MVKKIVKKTRRVSRNNSRIENKKALRSKEAPIGVKIIYILNYVSAALCIAASVFLLIFGIVLINNPNLIKTDEIIQKILLKSPELATEAQIQSVQFFLSHLGTFLIVLAFLLIPIAILTIYIARGLKNGKNWARIVEVVFAGIGILGFITNIFAGEFNVPSIGMFAINIFIFYYLGFDKEAQAFFGR